MECFFYNNQRVKQITKVLTFVFLFTFTKSWGQAIWDNPITGTNPNTSNPYTTGQTVNANITVSGIGRGSGITGTNANDRYNATSWSTAAFDANDYFEFTLTPCVGGGSINFVSFVYTGQTSGTGPTNFAIRSSVDSYLANIGTPNAGGTTINLSAALYQNITSSITFRFYAWGGTGGTCSINSFIFNGTTVACGGTPHTVTFNTNGGTGGSMSNQTASSTTALTSNGFTKTGCAFLSWNTAADGSGTSYANGASYSFASDITLYAQWYCGVSHTVTFNSNGGSGSMTAQTANTTTNLTNNTFTKNGCTFNGWNTAANGSGTAYTNGQVYNFATDITLYGQWNCSSVCPYLVSAVINSCDGCADEGNNEFLVLNTGSYSFVVNSFNVNITYSNGPTNITSSFAAQPTSLATLNTATVNACGTTFVDVSNGSITVPANSTLLIINKGACFTGDWSAYCGLGTVYVAFSAATAWSVGGFFGNNTSARSFVTNFSAVNDACGTTAYAYNQTGIAGTPFGFSADGASVIFSDSSGPSYINGNGTCAPRNIILPIELIDFYATQNDSKNELIWKVASEKNVLEYVIEKSEDGLNYSELTKVKAKNIEETYISYSCDDNFPFTEITYYRLSTIESNGKINQIKTIDLDRTDKVWNPIIYQNNDALKLEFKNLVPKNSTVSLFDLSGKLLADEIIKEYQTVINTQIFSEGIYFLKVSSPYKTQNFKIIIQK